MGEKLTATMSAEVDNGGFLKECILRAREGDDFILRFRDGTFTPYLDRYAIIPIEEYEALSQALSSRPNVEEARYNAVAGPISEDENGNWVAEIQVAGGHYVLADAYGETRDSATALQQAIIAALRGIGQ